jgi:DnaK suppressor protein
MNEQRAHELLDAEKARLARLLRGEDSTALEDRAGEEEPGGFSNAAESLTAQGTDDAIAKSIRARLDAIHRAEERLEAGTFGRSVRSGRPIPDERLEADPAAELTVDEASAS